MTSLITIQGSARGGKGTIAEALFRDLARDRRVYKIDQGLKFRILAKMALDEGCDLENLDALAAFVTDPGSKQRAVERLLDANTSDKETRDATYYTPRVGNASGMVGKLAVAQGMLVALLNDEVTAVAPDNDVIIVDGRALQTKGVALAEAGVVDYLLAIDVHCDAFVSAQRETRLFAPSDDDAVSSYTREEALQLLVATRDIARRNTSDARRATYPSLPLRGAYEFDVLHDMDATEWSWAVEAVRQAKAISVDNSATRTTDQLTKPVVRLVRELLEKR